ncbi:MAG: LytR C-terminal domain-containing protein [Candidatus Woesebacteria bacterium]|jgi:hypothetical protein
MLNTEKLLYILPDVAYIVELLPAKQAHSFQIQSFRQVNGKFLDDNEFIADNVMKLAAKVEEGEYSLVLPDFLFTNTIVNVKESSENKVKQYLKEKLLPELSLSLDTHQVDTTVLTEHKGIFKVQISALEKSLLVPLKQAVSEHKVKIKNIYSLSWTVKSIISLEPSISILQMGDRLYSTLHYIGVDQSREVAVSEAETLVETVKTLKGAEPSIQTLYLISSSLVEEKLKDDLSKIVPIQQLATFKEEDAKMPSYVQKVIESGMKTISIPDYQLPTFALSKVSLKDAMLASDKEKEKPETEEESTEKTAAKVAETVTATAALPKPSASDSAIALEGKKLALEEESEAESKVESLDPKESKEKKPEIIAADIAEIKESSIPTAVTATVKETVKEESKVEKSEIKEKKLDFKEANETLKSFEEVDLKQFIEGESEAKKSDDKAKTEEKTASDKEDKAEKKFVIKNKAGVNNMLKMFFIALASFSVTVAIGVGLGLGILSLTNKDSEQVSSPVVVAEASPTPEPTAIPTPEPEIEKDKIKILVVNATTTSGYAGKIKKKLEAADFSKVTARNAKGDYEDGFHLLMAEENSSLEELLEEATDLKLNYSDEIGVEDPEENFDLVIVLAE